MRFSNLLDSNKDKERVGRIKKITQKIGLVFIFITF